MRPVLTFVLVLIVSASVCADTLTPGEKRFLTVPGSHRFLGNKGKFNLERKFLVWHLSVVIVEKFPQL